MHRLADPFLDGFFLAAGQQVGLAAGLQLTPAIEAEVILPPLDAQRLEIRGDMVLDQGDFPLENLVLEVAGVGGDHHAVAAEDGRDEVGERLAEAGFGLDHQSRRPDPGRYHRRLRAGSPPPAPSPVDRGGIDTGQDRRPGGPPGRKTYPCAGDSRISRTISTTWGEGSCSRGGRAAKASVGGDDAKDAGRFTPHPGEGMTQLRDQAGHGQGEMLRTQLGKIFKEHRDAEPDRKTLIFEQLSGPGEVTGLLAHHRNDIVDMPQREKVGDDLPQLVIADRRRRLCCGRLLGHSLPGVLRAPGLESLRPSVTRPGRANAAPCAWGHNLSSPYHGREKEAIREWRGWRLDTGFFHV